VQRNVQLLDELFGSGDERFAHRIHERGRCHRLAAMQPEKTDHARHVLQLRLENVQVHAIDALDLQGHVIAHDIGDAAC
jgi:hypothetical protein